MNLDDLDAARREQEKLLELVDQLGLNPTTAAPGPDAEAFVAAMKARDHRRRVRQRFVALGTAAVAAVTVFAVVLLDPGRTQRAEAVTPPLLDYEYANARSIATATGVPAAGPLRSLADTAEAHLPAVEGDAATDSQVVARDAWYAEIDETTAVVVPQVIVSTLRPDGSQRIVESRGAALSPDGRGIKPGVTTIAGTQADTTSPPKTRDPALLDRLRGSPTQARSVLLDRADCTSTGHDTTAAWCLYTEILDLWNTHVVDNKVAANLWRMLSSEAGYTSLGTVRDRADRAGVGIAITPPHADQFRIVLIISATTGALLGNEEILIRPDPTLDLHVPAIYSFTAITSSRWQD